MSFLAVLVILAFSAAQGAAVFLTALAISRNFPWTSASAKTVLMAISWLGWVAFTVSGYVALGGEGGLMDGFGLLLFLIFTSFISSVIYMTVWVSNTKSTEVGRG